MGEITVNSFSEFHQAIQKLRRKKSLIFRGLSDVNYELIPSICRDGSKAERLKLVEKRLFNMFKKSAIAYIKTVLPSNDWEWLALAQHYGLPTKLMDWTYNPLIALFFAIEEKEKGVDRCVYVSWNYENLINMDINPFNLSDKINKTQYYIYQPPYFTERVITQSSVFTIHPLDNYGCNTNDICKIVIKEDCREELMDSIIRYGVDYKTIFPDLGGLCKDITLFSYRWEKES
ncbi:MAG: FRG domain-containing protein [Chitinivibrionia bacterium]|nr:FRG domain-containing protein [Chitinivibrionia bacterium]